MYKCIIHIILSTHYPKCTKLKTLANYNSEKIVGIVSVAIVSCKIFILVIKYLTSLILQTVMKILIDSMKIDL